MKKLNGPMIVPKKTITHVFVLLHGYGQSGEKIMNYLGQAYAQAFPDALITAPNAPDQCREFPKGFDWLRFDGEWITENIVKTAKKAIIMLNTYLDDLLRQSNLEDNQLVLAGFSQGGVLAIQAGLRRPKACAGIICFGSKLVWPDLLAQEMQSTPPVSLLHGEEDSVIRLDDYQQALAQLRRLGIPVCGKALVGVGHRVAPQLIEISIAWIANYLRERGGKPPQ